ncbi:polysaccharide biosynthesis/export family protein [Megamonas hypermegale]|uniref:polysaccharide biosynthesis/export family protein n=1 Tax=Megamonas hypermegale TaxID=158847 RepID=UPI00195B691B|nr:polysaccharide biosynthesis/export family protein [Megamonas hypermegale]MBM6761401.1 polysaccharide export protein [Megamonas hypermegale]
MYKKVIVTTAMLSMLAATSFAADKTDDDTLYMGLNTVPIEVGAGDTAIFKPAAITSMKDYDQHYRLYKYDVISLRIVGFDDLKDLDDIMIGTDGYVNLPYAGSVKLAGLTVEEAKAVLMQKFGKYLKIPDMSIMVTTYGPRKVQVLGEVEEPGTVELDSDDMNVTSAISKAGWVTTYGRIKKVQVLRIIDGTMYIKEANIKNYIEKHDITQNLELEDGDIVFIPKSNKIDYKQDILPLIGVYTTYKAITD